MYTKAQITEQIDSKLKHWEKYKKPINRISWTEYFILQSYLVSIRSHDSQTQCGCIIATKNHETVSTGYNGFISEIDDSVLPSVRPKKYPFFLHSEHNAILSCAKRGVSCKDCIAYVTGPPCINCLQYMHQSGITSIIYYDGNRAHMTKNIEYDINFEILKSLSSVNIVKIQATKEMDEKINLIKSLRNTF